MKKRNVFNWLKKDIIPFLSVFSAKDLKGFTEFAD